MIEARELRFAYGEQPVLEGVSFTLDGGGLTALLGGNGAGKTTLMHCMLGLQSNYEGALLLNGRDVRRYAANELARLIAYIPQSHYPAFGYTALDMVLMGTTRQVGAFASPGAKQRAAALDALDRMGIAALAGRLFTRLSGGERQLVLIARALAQDARVLLMDEPTASLDYGHQLLLLEQARTLSAGGYTLLMSTHNPQHALLYADRALALHAGRLIADGAPGDALTPALLQTLYGVETRLWDTPDGRAILPVSAHVGSR